MKKRLLYLQNGTKRQSVVQLADRFTGWGLDVDTRWAFNGEFPDDLDGYDGVFLSGSPHSSYDDVPFIVREHELVQDAAQRQIPMLGVCFGSQILASSLCGRDQVFRRAECEVGFKSLRMRPPVCGDRIANVGASRVRMFVWHNDEIRADHPDMCVLASSDACPNQIWRYRDLPIWGIQGHPELTVEESRLWFEENRAVLAKDGADVDELCHSTDRLEPATEMVRRFATVCLGGVRVGINAPPEALRA